MAGNGSGLVCYVPLLILLLLGVPAVLRVVVMVRFGDRPVGVGMP